MYAVAGCLPPYFFLAGAPALPATAWEEDAGCVSGLGCFGFLCSRLLRCCPFGIQVLLEVNVHSTCTLRRM
jgi:hypothetical protein